MRRSRSFLLAVSAVAVVAVAAMVIAMNDAGPGRSAVATGSSLEDDDGAPAEPLFLPVWQQEMLLDGTIVDLPGADDGDYPAGRPVRLADGRLLAVVQPPYVAGNPGMAVVLRVFTDGLHAASHELQPGGSEEIVVLVGAAGNEAILVHTTALRGCCVRITGLDLDTGHERTLVETSTVPHDPRHSHLADYGSGKVIFMSQAGAGTCRVQTVVLDSGMESAFDLFPCASPLDAAIGPDGDRAALVYGDAAGQQGLEFIDLVTGEILSGPTLIGDTTTPRECDLSDFTDVFSDFTDMFTDFDMSDFSDVSFSDLPDTSDGSDTALPVCLGPFGPERAYLAMAWTDRFSLRVASLDPCCGSQPQVKTFVID